MRELAAGLVAAALLFAAFARIEHRSPAPLLDLSLLRHRRFLGIQLLAAAPAYGFVVLLVLLPIRFAGIGERPEDLRVFDAEAFVDALLPEALGSA